MLGPKPGRPACKFCRKSKRRCDREAPCGTCTKYKKQCEYDTDNSITHDVIQARHLTPSTEQYFISYFNTINPIRIEIPFDINSYRQPLNPPMLLQLHSILGASTNATMSDKSIAKGFETAAVKLAAELFDDFSYDTALGMHLLTFYFWGINQELYRHYYDITISLCKRLAARTKRLDLKILILRLHISTIQLRSINAPNPVLLSSFYDVQAELEEISSHQTASQLFPPSCFTNAEFITYASFRATIQKNIFQDGAGRELSPIDSYTYESLRCLLENVDCIFMTRFGNTADLKGSIVTLARCFGEFLRAVLWQASGNVANALLSVDYVNSTFKDEQMICMAGPHFMSVFHYCFLIAHANGQHSLASHLNQKQAHLAKIYPAYEACVAQNFSLTQGMQH